MKNLLLLVLCLIIIACTDSLNEQINPLLKTEWQLVEAGEFKYGEEKSSKVLDYQFQIMKYEVTNSQYLDYLKSSYKQKKIIIQNKIVMGNYSDEVIPDSLYEFYSLDEGDGFKVGKIRFENGNFIINEAYLQHPVTYISYYGAAAFAKYYGLNLPNEYEWEKAARGKTGLEFSFGDTLSAFRANYADESNIFKGTSPVGFYNGQILNGFQTLDSPSPYGLYDMTGNVQEWTDSKLTFPIYNRIIRGGSWRFGKSLEYWLTTWFRHNHAKGYRSEYIGFRCVKTN